LRRRLPDGLTMYERHFGLAKPPFRITPDPEFFFPGGNRGAVLEALIYAISRGEGIVKVVGEVGSGKTMLCRMLERELPRTVTIIYLANPRLSAAEILHAIAFELKIATTADRPRLEVMHALQEFLLQRHAEGGRVVMFVEEAQAMPIEALEEIRMLSNLETSEEKLLQIVLFGQPEFDVMLARHDIRQLRDRITHGFALTPFDRGDIRDYLDKRIRASGYRGNALFSTAAVRAIERHSDGLLRRINVLADKALLAAFAANVARVDAVHVTRAAQDSGFARQPSRWRHWAWLIAAGAVSALVLAGVLLSQHQENVPAVPPLDTRAAEPAVAPSTLSVPAEPVGRGFERPSADPVPRVSAASGLVSDAHLGPRLELPQAVVKRWGAALSGLPAEE
jgi:MSHA biogenesis protein MshM